MVDETQEPGQVADPRAVVVQALRPFMSNQPFAVGDAADAVLAALERIPGENA